MNKVEKKNRKMSNNLATFSNQKEIRKVYKCDIVVKNKPEQTEPRRLLSEEDSFQPLFQFRPSVQLQRHFNPLRLRTSACVPVKNTSLPSGTATMIPIFPFLPHLRYVHLLHLCQCRGLEQDARAGWWPGPGIWHGQVDARSGFDIAGASLSQAGEGAEGWGERNQNTVREEVQERHWDQKAAIQLTRCTVWSLLASLTTDMGLITNNQHE